MEQALPQIAHRTAGRASYAASRVRGGVASHLRQPLRATQQRPDEHEAHDDQNEEADEAAASAAAAFCVQDHGAFCDLARNVGRTPRRHRQGGISSLTLGRSLRLIGEPAQDRSR